MFSYDVVSNMATCMSRGRHFSYTYDFMMGCFGFTESEAKILEASVSRDRYVPDLVRSLDPSQTAALMATIRNLGNRNLSRAYILGYLDDSTPALAALQLQDCFKRIGIDTKLEGLYDHLVDLSDFVKCRTFVH